MDWLRTFANRCAALFRAPALDAELDDELRQHIDLAAAENLRHGMSPEDARAAALREFGGVTQTRERYRLRRGLPLFEHLARDVRFGLRQLIKSPAFTLTAVLTLALGIGANSAVFSVVNSILLRPLPFPHPDRLVRIVSVNGQTGIGASPPDIRDFARQNHTFDYLVVFDQWRKNVSVSPGGENPENVHVGLGPLQLFQALGIHTMLGRLFTDDEGLEGRNHVALISQRFWQSHYGRDPKILSRTITINGIPYSIVGVLPEPVPGWIRGIGTSFDVWEPFLPTADVWSENTRSGRDYATLGLLKPGVSLQQAEADLRTIAGNLAATYPVDRGWSVALEPLVVARGGDLRPHLYLLMGAVTLILLIACSNLAALLLARNTARRREFTMRAALGASRATLVRQILVETMLVSLLGGALGVGFASTIDIVLRSHHPQAISQLADISLDWHVLFFTFTIIVGTSLLFGLAPAVLNTRINFTDVLKEGSRGSSAPLRHWFRRALVVGQIALSLMLMVGAALFVQTIGRLLSQQMGFRSDHLLKAHLFLPSAQYPTPQSVTHFCDVLAERLRALPGVRDASVTSIYPPYERWTMPFSLEGHPISRVEDVPKTFFGVTDAYYLRTAGIALVKGRDFSASDRETTPIVAIVNQAFVNRFLRGPNGGENPLGRRVLIGAQPSAGLVDRFINDQNVLLLIVGVMADSKNNGLASPAEPQLIALIRQVPAVNYGFKDVILRTTVAPESMEQTLVDQVHALDPRLPVSEMMTLNEDMEAMTGDQRFTTLILSGFAALGLVLAVIGIYGVISYLVAQRNVELGIRMALGAARSNVLWLIVRQGLMLGAFGVALGLIGTAIASRGLSSLLFGISALDVLTLSAASLFLLLVALAASAIPARRATRIDPIQVLRSE